MHRKLIAAAVLTALLAAAVGAALAAPGTADDPFVTLSYLTDTYYTQAQQAMLEKAREATADTEQAAFDKLDALAQGYLAQAGDTFVPMTLSRGERLDVYAGASLLFESGTCTLSAASGALVDVTAGAPAGGSLTAGHRYVAAENVSLTAVSDAASLLVQGNAARESAGLPFTDVSSSDWYYSDVCFAYENKLFQGLTATTFSPATNMSRSMLATVLYRLAGAGGSVPSAGFPDVPADTWYTDAVNWAAGAGVVNGYGDGTFAPDANVTREQMAAMLQRYARDYLGLETPASGDLSGFPDRAQISDWARDALSWAVGRGILNGCGDGTLAPGGTASRAEVAAMLHRFSNLLP